MGSAEGKLGSAEIENIIFEKKWQMNLHFSVVVHEVLIGVILTFNIHDFVLFKFYKKLFAFKLHSTVECLVRPPELCFDLYI